MSTEYFVTDIIFRVEVVPVVYDDQLVRVYNRASVRCTYNIILK